MKIGLDDRVRARLGRVGVAAVCILAVSLFAFAILRGSWVAGISLVLIVVAAVLGKALSR